MKAVGADDVPGIYVFVLVRIMSLTYILTFDTKTGLAKPGLDFLVPS